jgi:hypothetical protein
LSQSVSELGGGSLMSIVGAFDVHRRQLTFEYLATVSGELKRRRVVPADRERLRAWLARLAGQQDVHFALEGCTGWRYVTEELAAAGITPHPAEPADTAALRAGSGTPNRQGRRPASAGAPAGRGPARVLDPAGARAGGPGHRAAV